MTTSASAFLLGDLHGLLRADLLDAYLLLGDPLAATADLVTAVVSPAA